MSNHQYYVYIMTNRSGTLYTGMTNNLKTRVHQHKSKLVPGFTKQYNITRLIYFETFRNADSAIAREKVIKGWVRKKKVKLISEENPNWEDLSTAWYD